MSPLVLAACPGDDASLTTASGATTTTTSDTTGDVVPDTSTGEPPSDSTSTTAEPPADSTSSGGSSSTGPTSECGNGLVELDEECDDGNTDDGDGCAAACTVDAGWVCDDADPTFCETVCGDGEVGAPVEECDDANEIPDDDCTDTCLLPVCGDGILWVGNELCDDGGTDPADGCSSLCEPEPGYLCDGSPSVCAPAIFLADGASGISGNLWAMSLDGSSTLDMGVLGVPLTAMAFHPDGTLYGVTSRSGAVGGQLGTIDLTMPPAFNLVGTLMTAGGVTHNRIPDITFMGSQLLGWTENGDDLVLIDTATAMITVVASPQGSLHTALAYDSATSNIYLSPSGSQGTLYTVTPLGAITAGPTLGGTQSSVKGMSYFNGLLYGMDTNSTGGPTGNAVTYDPVTGAMITLGVLPTLTIDALAVYDPDNMP